ncbi:hypothetical protein WOLCODRAFT_163209 [Wolfiporia cocos MD-104 SS10]|uniref:Uncharacterized protein n=1 Tax=Wolfiporia cocos (strain MD-104) TaxID=742152 RepID=A0A2H3JS01_WOLCO|nr:hypothetical protein WOLCODRAFT_163209 [Wolfiporia cocos MD-104 SS10]
MSSNSSIKVKMHPEVHSAAFTNQGSWDAHNKHYAGQHISSPARTPPFHNNLSFAGSLRAAGDELPAWTALPENSDSTASSSVEPEEDELRLSVAPNESASNVPHNRADLSTLTPSAYSRLSFLPPTTPGSYSARLQSSGRTAQTGATHLGEPRQIPVAETHKAQLNGHAESLGTHRRETALNGGVASSPGLSQPSELSATPPSSSLAGQTAATDRRFSPSAHIRDANESLAAALTSAFTHNSSTLRTASVGNVPPTRVVLPSRTPVNSEPPSTHANAIAPATPPTPKQRPLSSQTSPTRIENIPIVPAIPAEERPAPPQADTVHVVGAPPAPVTPPQQRLVPSSTLPPQSDDQVVRTLRRRDVTNRAPARSEHERTIDDLLHTTVASAIILDRYAIPQAPNANSLRFALRHVAADRKAVVEHQGQSQFTPYTIPRWSKVSEFKERLDERLGPGPLDRGLKKRPRTVKRRVEGGANSRTDNSTAPAAARIAKRPRSPEAEGGVSSTDASDTPDEDTRPLKRHKTLSPYKSQSLAQR